MEIQNEYGDMSMETCLVLKAFVPMILPRNSLYILECGLVSAEKLTYQTICACFRMNSPSGAVCSRVVIPPTKKQLTNL